MNVVDQADVEHFLDFSTAIIGHDFDVAARIHDLQTWNKNWQSFDSHLHRRVLELHQELSVTKEKKAIKYIESKIAVIGLQRLRFQVLKIRAPLEISGSVLDHGGSEKIWGNLASQYARIIKKERRLRVLSNLVFLMHSELRNLIAQFKDAMGATAELAHQVAFVDGEPCNGNSLTLNCISRLH